MEALFGFFFFFFFLKLRNHIPRETCNTTPHNQGEAIRQRRSTKVNLRTLPPIATPSLHLQATGRGYYREGARGQA
jgi:hypothetical protein